MGDYVARHARRPEPETLPVILRGVADLITVVDEDKDGSE